DRQCANETKTGTGYLTGTASYGTADSSQQQKLNQYQIKCDTKYSYPAPVLTKAITDTDNDGMPDEWELARGLDPNDAGDTNGDYCGGGYTNIEYYINDLTVNAFPEGTVTLSPEKPKEPDITEPAVTEPVVTEPAVTEPEVTEPAVTDAPVTEPEVTEPAEPQFTKGDVNLDGSLTGADLVALVQTLLGRMELMEKSRMVSDMNDDGKLNIIDYILIRSALSK
ncbi:MAG: dockerin type I domain-containing protein, partial [Acutalibacteraceae bacterium]|nr:dockerin type I domain-containing protein [Acutalibacteraceae bacterium]